MKIKFLGAAATVTGSSYLVTSNSGEQILVDMGLFQGPADVDALNFRPFEASIKSIDGVILTHAHLDHCGRLPMLEKLGYSRDIYMTAPTADLTELSLLDSAKISHEDHHKHILFDTEDVGALIKRFREIPYHKEFYIGEFAVTFRDAGHIMGSASVEVRIDGKLIVFSGDLGNTPEDITRPTEQIASADYVIMESTYGDRLHPTGNPSDVIRAEIDAVVESGGTLLIPAFSLERTQELLHIIDHINPNIPVYLDSPMAQRATVIYEKYKDLMNKEITEHYKKDNPFTFPMLHLIANRQESGDILRADGAKVIIAGSGMMTGGRILGHAQVLLPIESTRLLIVGYQGEGTLGRALLNGATEVHIDGENVRVAAHISETQVMSSHADQGQLLLWLKHIKGVKKVFLTHGEDGPRIALAEKIQQNIGITDVVLPMLNQEIAIE